MSDLKNGIQDSGKSMSAQESSPQVAAELSLEEIIISAPKVGYFIVLVIALLMLSVALSMGKKFILTNNIQDALIALLGLGGVIASLTRGLSNASQKICLTSEKIIESNGKKVTIVLPVSEIRVCKSEKRTLSRAWVGVFDFSMRDGSKHEIIVAAKIFYQLKREMKKRYPFCHWK